MALVLAAVPWTVAMGATAAHGELQRLIDAQWQADLEADPLLATSVGESRYNDRLPVATAAEYARQARDDARFLARLRRIDRGGLSAPDRLNRDLLEFVLAHRVELAPFRAYRIPLVSDEGFHVEATRLADGVPMKSARDYDAYLARLAAIPDYFAQNIANMRAGAAEGFTLPGEILPGIQAVIDAQQYASAEESPFYAPFRHIPETLDAAARARLQQAARQTITSQVLPAYARFRRFFAEEYAPRARRTIGARDLPDGERYYAALVRFFTNLEVTPREVHETGLREVARIHLEMEGVIAQTGFRGDFAAFLEFLRTDPQFYARSPEELLKDAAFLAKSIDGRLPGYFGRLPRQPYSVEPVPADIAPNYTGGRYVPAPIGGTRGGQYWVNTFALDKRPLYVLPALTLHEAVPGHHLQGALAQELEHVPAFRRQLYPHAFGEGWGLYAEKLGVEMGIYRTPYEHFGRLTYEMWRACRLVVDTGMHALGWSRQQAQDYLAANTALSLHEIRTEVDRYIAWPGQALAYKMGELKILELRARAERALGPRFDLRAFHDTVLGNGGVPLPVLERQVDDYVARAGASGR
ncbi:MAG: DUF885 family protein [Proteobacteria bacterium]|nr:DUF885 family protein [Pseudomonadota bacterium]